MRFSVKWLLVGMAIAAYSFAAIAYADPWWYEATGLTMIVCVLAALVALLVDRGPRQAFAVGFVVFIVGPWGLSHVDNNFIDNSPIVTLANRVSRAFPDSYVMASGDVVSSDELERGRSANRAVQFQVSYNRRAYITKVCLQIFTLLFGLLGGALGWFLYSRRVRARAAT
jgi:hypothetical protein